MKAIPKISKYMSTSPITVGQEQTLAHAHKILREHRIRHLPVVANGRVTGMISIGDVVKLRIESMEAEADQMKTYIASAG